MVPFDVIAIQTQVEAIMLAKASTPMIEIVGELPNQVWGTYADGVVRISSAAPEACWPIIVAHELSHHIAIKSGMLRNVSGGASDLKSEIERIAAIVEYRFEPWSPGCMEHHR